MHVKISKPRNGTVNVGKARSSGNDGENINSDDRRRVSIRKARSSGNGDENINSKDQRGRRSREGHSRTEKRDLGRKNEDKDMENEGFKSENVNTKRKRVYPSQSFGNIETSNGGAMFKVAKNEIKKRVLKEKHIGKEKFEKLGAESSVAERKKYKGSEVAEKKMLRSKLRGKNSVEDEGMDGKYIYRGEGKEKSETRKQLSPSTKTSLAENTKKSANKKVKANKVAGNDSAEEAELPRKNKRIQIDPYDFSNKRMDDGLISKDIEEKKKDLPKSSNDVELSMNAQFRAICPSQSIISYVEDNLLGRRREIEIKRAGYNIDLSSPLDNIPFSTSSERERIEEPAFRNKLEFFAAAKLSSSFPPPELPEIAFAGRSNVGKSSMLNALTRQWGVVRTSDKPGLTQTINFFKLGSKLCLVDLPGYGFAYAKEEAKEAWEELVKEYVSTRVGLKRVCLLVDTKWGMKQRDYELVDLMERSKTKYQIVLTKTDLVFPIDVARRAMQIEESLKGKKSAVQPAMMVSSKSGAGIRSFRTALSKIARFLKP